MTCVSFLSNALASASCRPLPPSYRPFATAPPATTARIVTPGQGRTGILALASPLGASPAPTHLSRRPLSGLRRRRHAAAPAATSAPAAAAGGGGGGSSTAADAATTAAPPTSAAVPPALSSLDLGPLDAAGAAAAAASRARTARLDLLVAARRLYRNLLRADLLLAAPAPAYAPPSSAGAGAGGGSAADSPSSAAAAAALNEVASAAAVEFVAELQLTESQLRAGWRALVATYGDRLNDAFVGEGGGGAAAAPTTPATPATQSASTPTPSPTQPAPRPRDVLAARIGDITDALAARSADELPALPFSSLDEAQAAVDGRNRQYAAAPAPRARGGAPAVAQRLSAAEKAVEAFFMRRLQPAVRAVRDTPPDGWLDSARAASDAAVDLWVRLNGGKPGGGGGGGGSSNGGVAVAARRGLPPLIGTRPSRAARREGLATQVAALERRLQDASKAREARLRKASTSQRARLAGELRSLDDAVASLARALAVRTLQLEMEAVLGTLEDEALDVAQGSSDAGFLIFRQGSSDELTLLAAEAGLLDEQLAVVAASLPAETAAAAAGVENDSKAPLPVLDPAPALAAVAAAGDKAPPPSSPAVAYPDDVLDVLAQEVPDLRRRLGIADDAVFGGGGVGGGGALSLTRAKAAATESSAKLVEGALFFSRGIRLLGTDVQAACGLFARSAAGASLKPREVAALRRTARDVATFVPFTVILVTPITPVGHVLVFGFLQRYFPGFFPSQFTSRRQELMIRYEELRSELAAAQEAATAEAEAAELAAAAEAVRRLTAPKPAALVRDGGVAGTGATTTSSGKGGHSPPGTPSASSSRKDRSSKAASAALSSLESAVLAAAAEASGTEEEGLGNGAEDSDEDRNDARRA